MQLKFEPGGEPGLEKKYTPVTLDARLPLGCKGCGSCCRGRRDLLLSGYDLFRLSQHLSLPPEVFTAGFCDRYPSPSNGFPALRIKPRADTGSCPFLYNSRCTVHPARPLACALYPLGQSIDLPGGKVSYFFQETRCGGSNGLETVSQFLTASGIRQREPVDVRWAEVCTQLMEWLEEHPLTPLRRKVALRQMEKSLYFAYDIDKPFLPQLEENFSRLQARLADMLLNPRKDESDESHNP